MRLPPPLAAASCFRVTSRGDSVHLLALDHVVHITGASYENTLISDWLCFIGLLVTLRRRHAHSRDCPLSWSTETHLLVALCLFLCHSSPGRKAGRSSFRKFRPLRKMRVSFWAILARRSAPCPGQRRSYGLVWKTFCISVAPCTSGHGLFARCLYCIVHQFGFATARVGSGRMYSSLPSSSWI